MKNNNCVIAARLATSSWSRKAPACRPEPIRQAQGKLRAKHVVEGSIVAILLAMFLTACGDSSGDSKSAAPEVVDPVAETYATEDDLPGCIEKFEGNVALVEADSVAFKCEDGRWVNKGKYIATEENIKNCTEKREGEIAYIVDEDKSLVCQDGKWVKASNVSSSSSWTPEGGIGSCSSKVPEPAEGTSSSDVSSSSVESSSSSSVTPQSCSGETSVSSNSTKSSSSVVPSSSSVASSSSAKSSSSSAQSSSSLGWSWDVPKEAYLNPEITYGSMIDDRDNQVYKTVTIGNQTWMAENLNYADSTKTPSLLKSNWCYDDVAKNCEVAGRLYTWAAAIDSVALYDGGNGVDCGYGKTCTLPEKMQGICPNGWHLPTKTERQALFDEVGGERNAGKVLKSQTGWDSNGNGTDAVGFSALPAGIRDRNGNFVNGGYRARFWRTTEGNSTYASTTGLDYNADVAGMYDFLKISGLSVRCVKD